MSRKDEFIQIAETVPFDNSSNNFAAETVQEALEEIGTSASPGFTWGRSGTVTSNVWLLNDSVPSNTSGRIIFLQNAQIKKIFIANEDPTAGIVLGIYYHDGNGTNLTLLGTVTTLAQKTNTFDVNFSVQFNKQLAIKTESISVNAKNLVTGILLKGSAI
jgi:opacity protein-like surface antigen